MISLASMDNNALLSSADWVKKSFIASVRSPPLASQTLVASTVAIRVPIFFLAVENNGSKSS